MLGNVVTSWHAAAHPNAEADEFVPQGSIPVATVVEVTRSAQPEKVFELVVDSQADEPEIGWAVYRSERLPGLYPE